MRTNTRIVKPFYILATAIMLFSTAAKAQLAEVSSSKVGAVSTSVATDIKSGVQYIIVRDGYGLAITPRLCKTEQNKIGTMLQNGSCIANQ